MKVRVDQKRLGRKWLYPQKIRVCEEDGQQVAVISFAKRGGAMTVTHTKDFDVYDQLWAELGKITIPKTGRPGEC